MGTRSNIAYEKENGKVVVMYCHYDGYPQYNGVMLNEHYNTHAKARGLVDNGYQSGLKETVEKSNEGRVHEEPPKTYRSFHSLIMDINFDIEWVYLYTDAWYYAETSLISLPNGKYNVEVEDFSLLSDLHYTINVGEK